MDESLSTQKNGAQTQTELLRPRPFTDFESIDILLFELTNALNLLGRWQFTENLPDRILGGNGSVHRDNTLPQFIDWR